jgi:hypothetical protein
VELIHVYLDKVQWQPLVNAIIKLPWHTVSSWAAAGLSTATVLNSIKLSLGS